MKFSTKDQDNDTYARHCARLFKGAWWYKTCHACNLNGRYLKGKTETFADGITWYYWKGHRYSLKFVEMKIRPYHSE